MQEEKKVAWSTQDEINHINHMIDKTGSEALKLITGYITGIEQRTEWGALDKEKNKGLRQCCTRSAQNSGVSKIYRAWPAYFF